MDATDVLELVKRGVEGAGSQKDFATAHGMSQGFLHDVLNGRRDLSDKVLEAVGVERIITYRRKAKVPA